MPYFDRRGSGDEVVGHGLIGALMLVVAVLLGVLLAAAFGIDVLDARSTMERLGLGAIVREQVGVGPTAPAQTTAAVPSPEVASAPRIKPAPTAGSAAAGLSAPFCSPGQLPSFVLGFSELQQHLGAQMGEAVECEHANAENGDALQQTTTGLAYYRKRTNTPMFTDGWRHWALTSRGLIEWEGDSADPPRG